MNKASPIHSPVRSAGTILGRITGPVIIGLVGLVMLAISWRKWPDPLVDFGRELYVPWRLTEGQVLYRDLAYFNGPLSPYFNALVFRTFGTGLMSLAVVNMAILGGVIFILYRLLSFIGSRLSATVGCVCFLVIFALAQLMNTGNYNFICPYSHELTHGLALSLLAIYLLYRYQDRPRAGIIGLIGLCLGLILLTKPEVFLAAFLALGVGLLLVLRQQRPATSRLLVMLSLFAAGLLAPLFCFGLYLGLYMPVSQALRCELFSYGVVFSGELAGQKFYLNTAGFTAPLQNLWSLLAGAGWYVLLFGLAAGADRLTRRFGPYRHYIAAGLFFLVLFALWWFGRDIAWWETLRPLPLFMVALTIGLSLILARRDNNQAQSKRLILALAAAVFSCLLLAKIVLNAHAYHYGFGLAGPGAMLLVVVLLDWLPAVIAKGPSGGWIFKTVALAFLLASIVWHFNFSLEKFSPRTVQVGNGPDAFLVKPWPKGQAVSQACKVIAEQTPANSTFVVLPEGVTINYLTRRANPTKYISFMPPELAMFGQDEMLAALKEHPPDYIISLPRGLGEYGYHGFGKDYALDLARWRLSNYGPGEIIGQSYQMENPIETYVIDLHRRLAK